MTVPATNSFTRAQLDIIKKTCAPDTNTDEFNLFIESARLYGLNPMKRQIMAMVFSKDNAKKRRMSLIVEIGGLRSIAGRSGKYRPASEPTVFENGADVTDINPLGLTRAIVKLYKQDDRGEWFPVIGEAWWDEHVNTKEIWENNRPTGKFKLADTWKKMPRLMLAKCAEAQALRKGWPEDVGGLYEEAEGDVYDGDITATEALEEHAQEVRRAAVGKKDGEYAVQFEAGGQVEMISPGQMHRRCEEYYRTLESIMDVKDFEFRNKAALQRYWADDKDAALNLKEVSERRINELSAEDNEAVAS